MCEKDHNFVNSGSIFIDYIPRCSELKVLCDRMTICRKFLKCDSYRKLRANIAYKNILDTQNVKMGEVLMYRDKIKK